MALEVCVHPAGKAVHRNFHPQELFVANKLVVNKAMAKINIVFIILGKVTNTFGLQEIFRYNYPKSILNSGFNGFHKKHESLLFTSIKAT